MNGFYQVGDTFKAIYGQYDQNGSCLKWEVGENGVTKIEVEKADGPMGHYAVALIFVEDELSDIVSLHMCSIVTV